MKKFFCNMIVLLIGSISLQAVPSASFHADFNQDFSAASNQGSIPGKHSADILWENLATYLKEGAQGHAAVIGTGSEKEEDYHIEYPNKNFILPECGGITFWIQPENWHGKDRKFHVFFRAEGTDSHLLIYKVSWSSDLYFLISRKQKNGGKPIQSVASTSIAKWHPGEWHFVAAVWGDGEMKLYVDGFCRKTAAYNASGAPFRRLGIGGLRPTQWKTPQDYSLIDEVMLYNVKLTDDDVLSRYRACKYSRIPVTDEKQVVPRNIFSGFDPVEKVMKLSFSVKEVSPKNQFYRAKVTIFTKGKNVLEKILEPSSSEYKLSIPEKLLPPGDYQFNITILKTNSKVNQTVVHPFTIPKQPEIWRTVSVGSEPEAVFPWTAPEWNSDENVFSCWNRKYIFGKSALPEQIISGGQPLFTRPVQLTMDGQKINLGKLHKVLQNDEKIELAGSSYSGGFRFNTRIYGEMDGFFWVDLEVKKEKEDSVFSNLTLDFPFIPEKSTLFNAMIKQYGEYRPGNAGKFKSYQLNLFGTASRTMFVGNENVGMEWFCEELSSWNLRDQKRALELIPCKQENLLRLNFADFPAKKGTIHRFRFGFQALPVKPLPKHWRLMRVRGNTPYSIEPWFPWSEVHNIPDPNRKLPTYDKRIKKLKNPANTLWYFAGFSNSPYTAEWSYYGPLWSLTPPAIGTVGAENNRQWAFVRNCPAAPGYIDYYVYNLRETVRKLNIPHLYFDNQDAQFCDNALHGCGWKGTDGHKYKTFTLLATRELAKRIWRMFKKERPNGIIHRHMSAKTVTPVISFSDTIGDGEIYCSMIGREEHYMNIFDPEMFRAMFRCEPYGLLRYYHAQFQRAIQLYGPIKNRYKDAWFTKAHLRNHQDKIRHFKGYCLVHDVMFWPHFGPSCDDIWKIQDDFGFDGQEKFVLYNDPANPFPYDHFRVMVSCYVRRGNLLIIIMNDEKTPLSEIRFDPEKLRKLGVSLDGLKNAEDGTSVPVSGNAVCIQIPARDYRILVTK